MNPTGAQMSSSGSGPRLATKVRVSQVAKKVTIQTGICRKNTANRSPVFTGPRRPTIKYQSGRRTTRLETEKAIATDLEKTWPLGLTR